MLVITWCGRALRCPVAENSAFGIAQNRGHITDSLFGDPSKLPSDRCTAALKRRWIQQL